MSVDSGHHTNVPREEEEHPAVPRPRLRIRVLTMDEKIAIKNDYEREALELLKRQNFGHAKRFESRFLMKTGLKQDMNNALTAVGWENFTREYSGYHISTGNGGTNLLTGSSKDKQAVGRQG